MLTSLYLENRLRLTGCLNDSGRSETSSQSDGLSVFVKHRTGQGIAATSRVSATQALSCLKVARLKADKNAPSDQEINDILTAFNGFRVNSALGPPLEIAKFLSQTLNSIASRLNVLVEDYQIESFIEKKRVQVASSAKKYELLTDERLYVGVSVEVLVLDQASKLRCIERSLGVISNDIGTLRKKIWKLFLEVRKAVRKNSRSVSIYINSRKKENLVLSPQAAGIFFHEVVGHQLEEKNLPSDIKNKIFNPLLNIWNMPVSKTLFGSFLFDDIGNMAKDTKLVSNGIITGLITDNTISPSFNNSICLRRQDYRFPPVQRMSNIYVEPGTKTIKQLIVDCKTGIYIEKCIEGNFDPVLCDYSIKVTEAYRIKDGRLGASLSPFTIYGNTFSDLQKIGGIGNKTVDQATFCFGSGVTLPVGMRSPAVLIEGITIKELDNANQI
ncbi:TldD/PmbA family protein [Vibrio parahaemolyticus]|uniref:TldD/PmbA family protein n=1 Tax=Vibrio parahaemolyticus TaxID=670 RepID=UPI0011ED8924|nr:TldD/PmbA family protein [Vibrio parahaemolyticus]KAB5597575.1 hypothetical protein F0578_21505 [Vibrio parahaemolyticus]